MRKERISSLATQIRGVSYKPSDLHKSLDDGSIIVLRANNIDEGKINFDDVVYVDRGRVSPSQILKRGDVLICASSGSKSLVGKAAQVDFDKECSFGAFCKVVRSKPSFSDYLGLFFQSPRYRREISELAQGANINNIRNEDVDNLELPCYDAKVQAFIVRTLRLVSEIIKKRQKQLRALDELVKARFIEMFGDKDSEMKPLIVVCGFIDYRGKTPQKSEKGIPLITAKNVKDEGFSVSPQEFIPEENYEQVMTRGIPQINDVLFTTEAPLGNVCRIPPFLGKFCVGQRIITMHPKEELLTSEYLEFALRSKEFQNAMWQQSSGSTVKGIRSALLEKIKIPVPSMNLQISFSKLVHQVDHLKSKLRESLTQTETLFNSLMQQYFG